MKLVGSDGYVFPISSVEVIGRGNCCSIKLQHPFVSRVHLRLEVHQSDVTVTDMCSRNGTKVDGQPLLAGVPIKASIGSVISLADVVEYRIDI